MPSHDDEDDLSEGHDVDIKEYFKTLFKSRKKLWQELKHLIAPDDEHIPALRGETHVTAHIIKKNDKDDDEDAVDFDELDIDVEAPKIGLTTLKAASKEAIEQAKEIKQILYNRALPLSYIKDFQQETRKVVVRPPKKKDATETTPAQITDASQGVNTDKLALPASPVSEDAQEPDPH